MKQASGARENNFIAPKSVECGATVPSFLLLSRTSTGGCQHRRPLQLLQGLRPIEGSVGTAAFLFPSRLRPDNDSLKTVILKFREVFWVRAQCSPKTGMRRISPLPVRFPLYRRRAATRGENYRLSCSTEFYGHSSHSAPQAKWQGSPTLRQTSFRRPDTLNTVIWLGTKCLPIQGRSNRKLMAFPQNSPFYRLNRADATQRNSCVIEDLVGWRWPKNLFRNWNLSIKSL